MLVTIIASVIVLSVIIYVHELGHFLAAKRSGVRVDRFSLGLGPKLIGITRGETEYVLSAVPFGGYVKMAGEELHPDKGAGDVQIKYHPQHDWEFLAKKKSTRALIVLAGPVMNFILAVGIYTGLTLYLGVETISTTSVGDVVEGSPAWDAGIRKGDIVRSVDGAAVASWDQVIDALDADVGRLARVALERSGQVLRKTVALDTVTSVYDVGMFAYRSSKVGTVKHGGPAYVAGLRENDVIVSIDGKPISTWNDLRAAVSSAPGRRIEVEWERDGKKMSSYVTPRDADGYGLIDITYKIEKRRVGLGESLKTGFETSFWISGQLFAFLRRLVAGEVSRDMIGGPLRIGELAGETIRWGVTSILAFIAAISAQLSLLNLLPLPVLDGGHLLLLGIETATGRPITPRQRMIAQQIGFIFLVAVMMLVTFVDVSRFFGK